MKNIKNYNSYIKESNDIEMSFNDKYKNHIDDGRIKIYYDKKAIVISNLIIEVEESLDIPEFEDGALGKWHNIFIRYNGKESGYKKYYIDLPRSIDFGDVVSLREKDLSDLLKKSDKELRTVLQSKYDELFKSDEHIAKSKIRLLFSDYIKY